ncbi:MAG: TolC family protein [Planctomycetota bacterium]
MTMTGCRSPETFSVWAPDWDAALLEADADAPVFPEAQLTDLFAAPEAFDVAPGEPIELSLELVAARALGANRDLAVQRFEPVIVGTFEKLERGVFDPELFAEFTYAEQTASETDRGTGDQFSVESADTAAELGLRQTLPTGTDVEMSVAQERDTSNRAPEQQDARLGLTVTQQLLRGFGPAVNLARIRQAELGTRASRFELRGFAEALLAEAEAAYWEAALTKEQLAIVERSLEVARQQLDEVEQRIELGAAADADAAVARVEVSLREQAAIDADAAFRVAVFRLARLLDATPTTPIEPRRIAFVSPAATEPLAMDDFDDRLALARRQRPDLAEARLRLQQNRLETVVTRNGLLPQLEVFASLGKTGFSDRLDDSFTNLDEDTYDFSAGLRFSRTLGNDAAEARNRAAYATRAQSVAAIANLEQLVELDVRLAATELRRAEQQIEASRQTLEYQRQTVAAERQRLEAGVSTALLLAQAERDLLQAQIDRVRAVVAYRLALIDLYLAEGTLLDRRGISVFNQP